jgi:hypothetical protein
VTGSKYDNQPTVGVSETAQRASQATIGENHETPHRRRGSTIRKCNRSMVCIGAIVDVCQRGRRRRYAGSEVVEVLPFCSQNIALRLSPFERTVCSCMPKQELRASRWRSPPTSSRSELVMFPEGFKSVTRRFVTYLGQVCRHTTCASHGVREGPGNQMPPAPTPEAS